MQAKQNKMKQTTTEMDDTEVNHHSDWFFEWYDKCKMNEEEILELRSKLTQHKMLDVGYLHG